MRGVRDDWGNISVRLEMRSRRGYQKWLEDMNAAMQKQDVPGYAEIADDTLTVHSERAASVSMLCC
jgi:hypothetical protein